MTKETPTLQELRARFTMPIGQVAAAFGMPKETLRARMKAGHINLSARRFGANTSPFLFDPTEIPGEVARYAAWVEGQS